jgi:two-component system response regulator DctR
MIVEDNPAVAELHKRLLRLLPSFRTVHVAWNGQQAAAAILLEKPDLVLLDLTMPGGDGLEFLRWARREALAVEVIVVTASRDGRTVREAMHLGVSDYLVKPFAPERFARALTAFAGRRRTLGRTALSQADIDRIQGAAGPHRRQLPKGLSLQTLRAVVAILDAAGHALSAEEVGDRVGIARVTARRYLDYLEVSGAVLMSPDLTGRGRPRHRYVRCRKP